MRIWQIVIVGAGAGLAALQPFRPVVVTGQSMMPTLRDHQVLIGRKDIGELRRGDVVVVDTPEGTVIKRVAFLPGDRIPQYFSQDEWVMPVSFAQGKTMREGQAVRRDYVVPSGQVFVLGDNVYHSIDSRHYGAVSISSIRLRVEGVPDLVPTVPGTRFARTTGIHLGA